MSDSSSSSGLYMVCPQPVRRPLGVYGPTILNMPGPRLNTPSTPSGPAVAPGSNLVRPRGLSRSLSAPDMTRNMIGVSRSGSGTPVHLNPLIGTAAGPGVHPGSRNSTSSVRHLTCFWWKEKGSCRLSDDDCLYAHYDTGHYTDAPRQLIPGEPAMAGRRLDRAMRGLIVAAPRSAISLNNTGGSRPATPGFQTNVGAGTNSFASSFQSPLSLPPQLSLDHELTRLNEDNQFLRTLVDQNGKEKAIMISTIESLQEDNKAMKGELEGLRKAQEQLLAEREGLHKRLQQLEGEQAQNVTGVRSISNPFGAIGRGRVNTETRYLGGLLTEE